MLCRSSLGNTLALQSQRIMTAPEPTFGRGTSHLPAFCFRFCLIVLLNTLALST